MAEFPSPQAAPDGMNPPVTAALIVYSLFALAGAVSLMSAGLSIAPLFGLVGFVGLVIAYVKRDDAEGTWVASHFNWLLRTFWWALGWALVGWAVMLVLGWVLVGIPIAIAIWFATAVWILYRVIRGYLLFMDSKPISGF